MDAVWRKFPLDFQRRIVYKKSCSRSGRRGHLEWDSKSHVNLEKPGDLTLPALRCKEAVSDWVFNDRCVG